MAGCKTPAQLTDVEQGYVQIRSSTHLCPGYTYRTPMRIRANNTTLDCHGASIEAPESPAPNTHGIWLVERHNVEIRNCVIRGWDGNGISVQGPLSSTAPPSQLPYNIVIEHVEAYSNTGGGVFLRAERSTIAASILKDNHIGVYFEYDSNENLLVDSVVEDSTREGVAIDSAFNNNIFYNRIVDNDRHGVAIYWNCGEKNIVRANYPSGNVVAYNFIRGHARSGVGYDAPGDLNQGAGVAVGVRQGKQINAETQCVKPAASKLPIQECPSGSPWPYVYECGVQRYRDSGRGNVVRDNKLYNNQLGVYAAYGDTEVRYNDFSYSNGNDVHDVAFGNVHLDNAGEPIGGVVSNNAWASGKSLRSKRVTTAGTCGTGGWVNGECRRISGNDSVFSKDFLNHAF